MSVYNCQGMERANPGPLDKTALCYHLQRYREWMILIWNGEKTKVRRLNSSTLFRPWFVTSPCNFSVFPWEMFPRQLQTKWQCCGTWRLLKELSLRFIYPNIFDHKQKNIVFVLRANRNQWKTVDELIFYQFFSK